MVQFDPQRRFINKWEMYKLLSQEEIKPGLLPFTVLYEKEADLVPMLRRYHCIYVKPISTWGGEGIFRIQLQDCPDSFVLSSQGEELKVFFDEQEDGSANGKKELYYPTECTHPPEQRPADGYSRPHAKRERRHLALCR